MRLRDAGFNNSEAARTLGVSEAAVRRGLKRAGYLAVEPSRIRVLLTELAEILEHYPV